MHHLKTFFLIVSLGLASVFVTGCASSSDENKTAFLFAYPSKDSSGLKLAWSENGYDWNQLGWGGRRFLDSKVGSMNSPSVACDPDGTYHLVWTTWVMGLPDDAIILVHASTKDFLNWSEQQRTTITMSANNKGNWGSKVIYNENEKNFLIFWMASVEHTPIYQIYSTTTRDFKTFSTPKKLYDVNFSASSKALLFAQGKWNLIIRNDDTGAYLVTTSDNATGPFASPPVPFVYDETKFGVISPEALTRWENAAKQSDLPFGDGSIIEVPMSVINRLRAQDMFLSRPPPVTRMFP